jgi:hypothetical protein
MSDCSGAHAHLPLWILLICCVALRKIQPAKQSEGRVHPANFQYRQKNYSNEKVKHKVDDSVLDKSILPTSFHVLICTLSRYHYKWWNLSLARGPWKKRWFHFEKDYQSCWVQHHRCIMYIIWLLVFYD